MTAEQALASPMLLIGTPDACIAQLRHRAADWGVTQFIFITHSEKLMRILASRCCRTSVDPLGTLGFEATALIRYRPFASAA